MSKEQIEMKSFGQNRKKGKASARRKYKQYLLGTEAADTH